MMRILQVMVVSCVLLGVMSTADAYWAFPEKACVWETDGMPGWQCSEDISYDGYSGGIYFFTVTLCAAGSSDDKFKVVWDDYGDTATTHRMYDDTPQNVFDNTVTISGGFVDYSEQDVGCEWDSMDTITRITFWAPGSYDVVLRWDC